MEPSFRTYWHGDQAELHLLLEAGDPDFARRRRAAVLGALVYHAMLVTLALWVPWGPAQRPLSSRGFELALRSATPLIAPRIEDLRLTQKEANTAKPAAEVDLAALLPRAERRASSAGQPRPQPAPLTLPPSSAPVVPRIEVPGLDVTAPPALGSVPPPPGVVRPPEPPKLAFERVGTPQGAIEGLPAAAPKLTPSQAAGPAFSRGAGTTVGDGSPGGVAEMHSQTGAPGRPASQLQLLSDPQGVDFRPYLVQVLAAVRRNWMAVFPESARFGRQGRVAIQFAIGRNGGVPKLVIASPSGTDALDRAAVAGVSASNPFPPLPAEFRGEQIRVQLVFSYNMPNR
jgi:TonB family protein